MSSYSNQCTNGGNPWYKPINSITWGFAFTIMTFNFFNLNYILPTIGVALLFVGFYDLRNINKDLHTAWNFSIINLIMNIFNLIYMITPLHVKFDYSIHLFFIITVFQISFLLIFRMGSMKICQEAKVKLNKDPLLWLVVWRIVVVICVVTQLGSIWFIFIPLIFFYFYNFTSLNNLSKELNHINFTQSQENINFRSKKYFAGYFTVCAFIVILCSTISNHLILDEVKFTSPASSESRQRLIELGFPEKLLKDITSDQIALLEDAVKIDTDDELLMFSSKDGKIKGQMNLKATSIYVLLKDGRIYGIHHFKWQDGSAYWHDGFTISGSAPVELISGSLLYEKDGVNYSANIPRLKNHSCSDPDLFGNVSSKKEISGAVNYPFGSNNQRGYVFYELNLEKDVILGGIVFNYIHHKNPIIIPYEKTEEKNTMFSDNKKQLYTNFERRPSN